MSRGWLAALLLAWSGWAAAADPSEKKLAQALHRGADSLFARIGENGRFEYRRDAQGREQSGYNVVRHAGVLWVLANYIERYPDSQKFERWSRASRWLEHCCLRPLPGQTLEAVWSDPEGKPELAKLGAAGLALAAWRRPSEGFARPPAAALERLARFILLLQHPDGHFDSKFLRGRREGRWVSLYYPGEAALGLLAQARSDGQTPWRDAARAALQALAAKRAASGDYPADHWGLLASLELQNLDGRPSPELQRHAAGVARAMLAQARPEGDFGHERRISPTATRLEGLSAAHDLLGEDEATLRARILPVLSRGSRFLMSAQRPDGALPRGAADSPDPRRDELRIDDTQHAIAAWMSLCRIQKYSCTRP